VNNKTQNLRRVAQGAIRLWRTTKWFKYVVVGGAILGSFGAGQTDGAKQNDPRHTGGPGSTVTEEQVHGKWDGIFTLPDGTPMCMANWPCEDGGLDK
jgi:hypothetical protein